MWTSVRPCWAVQHDVGGELADELWLFEYRRKGAEEGEAAVAGAGAAAGECIG